MPHDYVALLDLSVPTGFIVVFLLLYWISSDLSKLVGIVAQIDDRLGDLESSDPEPQ
jgi:hypothetical protein